MNSKVAECLSKAKEEIKLGQDRVYRSDASSPGYHAGWAIAYLIDAIEILAKDSKD